MIACGICTARLGPGDLRCPGCGRPVTEAERCALGGGLEIDGPRPQPRVAPANPARALVVAALSAVAIVAATSYVAERTGGSGRSPSWDVLTAADSSLVDLGRVRLVPCALETVSFPTPDEGWVTDACGHAFYTGNGGVSFRSLPVDGSTLALEGDGEDDKLPGHVSRIESISSRRAVAFGAGQGNVMLSSDGGRSWQRAPLRDEGRSWIYASAHAGESVWACGSSGVVFRSRDGGSTFARTARTPFNSDNRCMALSFLDDRLGWAGGMDGTLFETRDGGDRWTRLRPPRSSPPTGATTISGAAVRAHRTTGVLRLSRREGWVALREEADAGHSWTYFTADGGASWIERPAPETEAADLAGASRWGAGGLVSIHDGRLRFSLGGQLVRDTPLVEVEEHAFEIMRGREPLEPGHLAGFTDHALLESFDDGRSWSTLARVAEGSIRRAVRADSSWLLELADGRILTPGGSGGPFALVLAPSAQPAFDRFRMNRVAMHRLGLPAPPGPLAALADAAEGSLDVRLAIMGCDGGNAVDTHLVWTGQGATVTVEGHPPVALAPGARARLLRLIAAAVEVPDDARHGCTTELSAELTWRAGAAAPEKARFSESDCSSDGQPPEVGPAHRVRALLTSLLGPRGHQPD